jgi:hypothetical protein
MLLSPCFSNCMIVQIILKCMQLLLTLTVTIFQSTTSQEASLSLEVHELPTCHGPSSVSSAEPVVPEPITLPHYDEWDMFITCGNSTDEIWGQLIGEEYSVSLCYWFTVGVDSLSCVRGKYNMLLTYSAHRLNSLYLYLPFYLLLLYSEAYEIDYPCKKSATCCNLLYLLWNW